MLDKGEKMGSRTRLAILLGALVFVFAACGDDKEASSPASGSGSGNASAEAPSPSNYCGTECQAALKLQASAADIECKVGLSWNSAAHPYGAATIRLSKEAAKSFPGMELFVADGRGDPSTQTGQVEDLLARGIDALILSPADAKALAGVAKRAEADGVKVIASDRSVEGDVTTYIGSDNVEAGAVAGKHIVELLKDGGNVVELAGSLGASPTIDRGKGFRDAIKGSKVKLLDSQAADYDRAKGLKVMEDLLQRYGSGKIDAVFTHNDEMSLGAIQAIKEAGREDEIQVVGIDGQESALKAIEAGDYAASVVYPLPVPEHIIAAAKVCADEELPKRIKQESTLVTKENVAEIKGTTF
jgi:ribose transport system substrate-binding protein